MALHSHKVITWKVVLLLSICLLCITDSVYAQENNVIVDRINQNAQGWASNLVPALHRLFLMLATLDLAWLAVRLTLKTSPLEEWVSQLIKKLFFYGIGLYFLFNGFTLAKSVTDSFIQLAGVASGSTNTLSATTVWEKGLDAAELLFTDNSIWDGFKMQLIGGFTAILILLLAAYISAVLLLAYAEAFIVMGAGTVVLGFLGSDWTKDYGRKYLNFALMTGLKLFITLLLGQLGLDLIDGWLDSVRADNIGQIFGGLGSFVVFALLIQKIPNTITSMMAGGGIQGSESVAASAVKTAAVAATVAATGGATAVTQASRLARAEGAKGIGGLIGGTTKNLAKSFAEDLSTRASRVRGASGSGLRMSSNMQSKIDAIKAKNEDTSSANSIGEGKEASSETKGENSTTPSQNNASTSPSTSSASNSATSPDSTSNARSEDNPSAQPISNSDKSESSPQLTPFDPTGDNMEQSKESQVSSATDAPKSVPIKNSTASKRGSLSTPFDQTGDNAVPQSKVERLQQRIKKRENSAYKNPFTKPQ